MRLLLAASCLGDDVTLAACDPEGAGLVVFLFLHWSLGKVAGLASMFFQNEVGQTDTKATLEGTDSRDVRLDAVQCVSPLLAAACDAGLAMVNIDTLNYFSVAQDACMQPMSIR